MVLSYLLNPLRKSHGLDYLAYEFLGHEMIKYEDICGSGKDQKTFDQIDVATATRYAAEDADITFRLYEMLSGMLESRSLQELHDTIEVPLVNVLTKMELDGVLVDKTFLETLSSQFEAEVDVLTKKIYALSGEEFNIKSTKQLATILFDKLKIPPVKKTKTGYSTDASVLEKLSIKHELPRVLLEYREIVKLKSTYVDALPRLIRPETGRIHTSYNHTVVVTGRLSSTNPNLQNIPIRTERGREIRKAFIAPPGSVLISADYSQIELRLLAHLSKDPALIEAFLNDEDIHLRTASIVLGVPLEEVTSEMRSQAKAVNFGVIYGQTAYGLSQSLGIPQHEAQHFIDGYFGKYNGVRDYIEEVKKAAHKDGYVETMFHRRRTLPDINSRNKMKVMNSERLAINTPIQGTAADLIKLAMINIDHSLSEKNSPARMIMQVHDELVFEVPVEHSEEVRELVVDGMENVMKLDVPLRVSTGVGSNWQEAH
jgi:DNA polymerase-1